jgi:hypothetical protein
MTYRLQIGSASRICAGQRVCGDQFGIFRRGHETLIIVADGLGHGPEANVAARAACDFVKDNLTNDLDNLMTMLNEALAHTRGAAVTLLHVDMVSGEIRHTGVGNVQLVSRSQNRINPVPVPGVVGAGLRKIVTSRFQLSDGDFIVVYTDGISSRLDLRDYTSHDPQNTADQIMSKWSKSHDDATCVAISVRN